MNLKDLTKKEMISLLYSLKDNIRFTLEFNGHEVFKGYDDERINKKLMETLTKKEIIKIFIKNRG